MVAGVAGCRTRDDRQAVIHVPEMKNKACAEVILQALARVPSVQRQSVRLDAQRRRVTLTYDSLNMSLKNVEFAIAEAGFTANEVPASAEAAKALSPECRLDATPATTSGALMLPVSSAP